MCLLKLIHFNLFVQENEALFDDIVSNSHSRFLYLNDDVLHSYIN